MASTQKIVLMTLVLNMILGIAYGVSMDEFTNANSVENYVSSQTSSGDQSSNNEDYLTTTRIDQDFVEGSALDQLKTGRNLFSSFFTGLKVGATGEVFWKGNNYIYTQMESLMLGILTMLVWVFDALLIMEAYLFFKSNKTSG